MSPADPTITVSITAQGAVSIVASVAAPMIGSMFSLTCTVSGAERLTDSTITFQWFKNGVTVSGQTVIALSFSSFIISDAGSYSCLATVSSSLLSGPIAAFSSNSVDVTLTCRSSLIVDNVAPALVVMQASPFQCISY